MSDERLDRSPWLYGAALVVGLPAYGLTELTDVLALDILGWVLVVAAATPVALYELWGLLTLPLWVAERATPQEKRARALDKAARERAAARRRAAAFRQEREAERQQAPR